MCFQKQKSNKTNRHPPKEQHSSGDRGLSEEIASTSPEARGLLQFQKNVLSCFFGLVWLVCCLFILFVFFCVCCVLSV